MERNENDKLICSRCKKPVLECQCEEKNQKIHIDVTMTKEMKELQEKLHVAEDRAKELEAINVVAMEAANENAAKAKELDDFKKAHPPTGKATNPSYGGGSGEPESFKDRKEMVDVLYDRAHFHKANFTPEQVSDAKRKLDELWRVVETDSASKRELKRGGSVGSTSLMACPNKDCGYTIDTLKETECSHCGRKLLKHDLESGRRR